MKISATAVAGSSTNVVNAKVSKTTTVVVIATLKTRVLAPVCCALGNGPRSPA
jgi:hypothetical protein